MALETEYSEYSLELKNYLNDQLINTADSGTKGILHWILRFKPECTMNNLAINFLHAVKPPAVHRVFGVPKQQSKHKLSSYDKTQFFKRIETVMSLLLRENDGQPLDTNEKSRLCALKIENSFRSYCNALGTEVLCALFPHVALDKKLKSIEARIEPVNKNPKLHPAFYLPEFGALIPTQKLLKKEEREALIVLHLLAQEKLKELPISLHIRHMVLKKQMEASQLSDEQKFGELLRLGLIYGGGDPTPETQAGLDQLLQCEPVFCKHVNFRALD